MSRRRRLLAIVVLVVATVLAAVVAARVLRTAPSAASAANVSVAVDPNPVTVPGSWERYGIGPRVDEVRVDGDRTVVVSFVGSPGSNLGELGVCELAYRATVTETDREVTVSLTSYSRPSSTPVACAGMGARRALRLHLAAPLGDRVVRDSVGDEVHRAG